jgi:hypothetical protein
MLRCLCLALLSLAGAAPARQQASPLTGREETARFEIHFRPDSRAEAAVDRIAALVEGDLDRILAELGLAKFPHTIRLFLYDDVAELQRVTGVPSGGHSGPLESHVPYDSDQTRVHELVHVVAEKFTETGAEPRNLFFAEGLANAVLRFVHDLPVDAVAAFHLERGELPALTEVHALTDFYAWLDQHPGVNGYDIAGSYMRYLLDEYGAAKVRRYYKGVPAKTAFGADLAKIEKGWHARLAAVTLRPGARSVLAERSGVTAAQRDPAEAKLTAEILGPDSEWHPVPRDALADGEPGAWAAQGTLALSGQATQGDWCVARVSAELGDALVRCTLEPGDAFGVQIQLGIGCQAMVLRGQGAFLYDEVGGIAHAPHVTLGETVEIVLRRQAGVASVWVDGVLVGEAKVDGTPARLGVGCVGGKARARDIRLRRL